MYSENPGRDALLIARAVTSNVLAKYLPSHYVRLTGQTGRGSDPESPEETARYFLKCFHDYFSQIDVNETDYRSFLTEKSILEYGPGDTLGVALLMYAFGAKKIKCVDRFPLSGNSTQTLEIYKALLNLLDYDTRTRANGAFLKEGVPESGFRPDLISYSVTENGLSGDQEKYDLVISRAVLEHVNNLDGSIRDIRDSLKPGGISIHLVDLKSHGLDRYLDFDFLTWPDSLYNLMYSHKGFPNRWRVCNYLELLKKHGLELRHLTATGKLEQDKLDAIKSKLAKQFRDIPSEELSWKGFWMVIDRA